MSRSEPATVALVEKGVAPSHCTPCQNSKEYLSSSGRFWKPRTLSAAVLVSAATLTAVLAAALAFLQWQSARNGALFFANKLGDFSPTENFLYRYLPTIVIVLYGVGWSWIELDVKRMEPWFQLAQPGGVIAQRSLLLQYPLDFLPVVPFRAASYRSVESNLANQLTDIEPIGNG